MAPPVTVPTPTTVQSAAPSQPTMTSAPAPPGPLPGTSHQPPIGPSPLGPQSWTFPPPFSGQAAQFMGPQFPGFNPAYLGVYGTAGFASAPSQYPGWGAPGQAPPPPGTAPPAPAAQASAVICNTGPANNQAQWQHAFGRDEKYEAFRLKNLHHGVFDGEWNDAELLTIVAAYARIRAHRENARTRYSVSVYAIGEAIMDCLPDAYYLDQAAARAEFVRDIASLFPLRNSGWIYMDQAVWTAALAGPLNGLGFQQDLAAAAPDPLPLDAAYKFLLWVTPLLSSKTRRAEIILWMLVAMVKQGNISDRFANKVLEAFSSEVGINVSLPQDGIKKVWDVYGPFIDEITAPAVFQRWLPFVPQNALRVRLTIMQASGEGLTAFSTIMKAMRAHPRFNWTRISQLYSDEWSCFQQAVMAVGSNTFYGYKKELGCVRSTLYKNMGYVAKELLYKVSGDAPINMYAGWTRSPAYRTVVDEMVAQYEIARAADMGGSTGTAYLQGPDALVTSSVVAKKKTCNILLNTSLN